MSTEWRENARIALVLRATRNILGMTLKQLGDVIGAASSSIGKWENNDLGMRATTYLRLLSHLSSKGIDIEIDDDKQSDYEIVIRVKRSFLDQMSDEQGNKHLKKGSTVDLSGLESMLMPRKRNPDIDV